MSESEEVQVGLTDEDRKHREKLQDEFKSDRAKCAECGAPVDNVRATCSNCGHEYEQSEYDQDDAGTELVAGVLVDEQGNERTGDEDLENVGTD